MAYLKSQFSLKLCFNKQSQVGHKILHQIITSIRIVIPTPDDIHDLNSQILVTPPQFPRASKPIRFASDIHTVIEDGSLAIQLINRLCLITNSP